MFRHDSQHSGRSNFDLGPSLIWQRQLGDSVSVKTCPLVVERESGDAVLIGSQSGLHAFSSSGESLWVSLIGLIEYAPLVVSGDTGIWLVASETLFGLSWSGEIRSRLRVGVSGGHLSGFGNRFYVLADDRLWALDRTGRLLWQTEDLGPGFENTSAVVDTATGNVYVITLGNTLAYYDYRLYGFDSLGGQFFPRKEELLFWPGGCQLSPVISSDTLYFGLVYSFGWQSGLLIYDLAGNLLHALSEDDGLGYITPVVHDSTIVLSSIGFNNRLKSYQSCQLQWLYALEPGYSSPVVDDSGNLAVGTIGGQFLVFNSNGGIGFEYDSLAGQVSSPAVDDSGAIYVATDAGWLYKFAAEPTGATEPEVHPQVQTAIVSSNPFAEQVSIVSQRPFKIYDLTGRLVFAGQPGRLNWGRDVTRGIYFVETGKAVLKLAKVQ
ncbi:MAG: hypothetical protein PHV78_01940 [Patescibacteria group bacterium]|nr:hypothetical protein [Patescibacteria group bacterium]MDD5395992.1 hypothetical protein [Patescibacteria group bacterium]